MKKGKFLENKTLKNIAVGVAVGFAVMLFGALVGAYLISGEIVKMGSVNYISVVVILCSAFVATMIGGKGTVGKERLLRGAVTGCVFWLVLIALNLMAFGGKISGAWVTGILVLACAVCSFLIFGKSSHKKKYRIPKY